MTEAILRFTVPDPSVTKDDGGLFATVALKEVVDQTLTLKDARNDTRIVKGAAGLDVQGFAYIQYWSLAPPKDPEQPQWYWMPEWQPDEVLMIKFADTTAEIDPSIARCCPPGAVVVLDTAQEEPR